ncbi:MAG: universal stress protein [Flavobacteriaceae bacterium]|nr:universal stress protein [Flavobacteriaceae bacterium]
MEQLFKKILVTSEKANTFPVACEFAEFLLTKTLPDELDFLFVNEDLSHYNEEVKGRVKDCINLMHSKGIMTEHSFRQGNFHHGTIDMATHNESDLIICGAELVKGFRRFWNGSETYKLMKASPCYVISVQKPMKRFGIKNIIIPVDSSGETRQKVPAAIQMAKLMNATIHVVGVSSTKGGDVMNTVQSYTHQTAEFLAKKNVNVVTAFMQGTNLTDITLQYAEDQHADLIIIMATEEPNPYGMFEGSFAEQMILKSEAPVMAIKLRDDLQVSHFSV